MERRGGRWPLLRGARPWRPLALPTSTAWPGRAPQASPTTCRRVLEPSSAIACMSVMGFDPGAYYSGRGPIEATAMGIELEAGQVAMRCNLVTIVDDRMVSYSAGNITSAEAEELVAALREGAGQRVAGSIRGRGLQTHTHRSRRGCRFLPPSSLLRTTSPTSWCMVSGPRGPGRR